MSDELCEAIGRARSGFVQAPAGCGKTETIAKTVGLYCDGCQLILTHTHAGLDVLRQRLRRHGVPSRKYHLDTIAGWAWSWVRMYPRTGGYVGSDLADWATVYPAMLNLLQKPFVQQGILNSYSGVLVDEYQDCTAQMHVVIAEINRLLPCRVLGDDLQGIFGFKEELVDWSDVVSAFSNNLGTLETPHRWIEAGNEKLGHWLLGARAAFRAGREPSYRGSPVQHMTAGYDTLSSELSQIIRNSSGRICVIGSKKKPLPPALETLLVKQKFHLLEQNELSVLRELVETLCDGPPTAKAEAARKFFKRVFGGVSQNEQAFLEKLLGNKSQQPRRADRLELCDRHTEGATPSLLLDLLNYVEARDGISRKLRDSISALRSILEQNLGSGMDLKSLYVDEIAQRKYQSRSRAYRCSGSTLLVKGLEFDHAIILRDPDWQTRWGSHRDVYVALTRGSKSARLIDIATAA
jgi:DNA helicase-2/ATP-dependent DNA helicase PcrA